MPSAVPIAVPWLADLQFRPPLGLSNRHAQTILPSLLPRRLLRPYIRQRLELSDGDFLDLDWATIGADRLAIVAHGLEGDSRRPYVVGMVRAMNRRGWDALAWNFRACSGEPNRIFRLYHSGASDDLDAVVQAARQTRPYKQIVLIGFSLGANLTLKYAAEHGANLSSDIVAAAGISTPCDLAGAADAMAQPANGFYMKRFLRDMRKKVRLKMRQFPGRISDRDYDSVQTFWHFDDRYTAPMHGFESAADYYAKCHCGQFLHQVAVPTLILNAWDDPFLSPSCFPTETARRHSNLYLAAPALGGHVGFFQWDRAKEYWSESLVGDFFDTILGRRKGPHRFF